MTDIFVYVFYNLYIVALGFVLILFANGLVEILFFLIEDMWHKKENKKNEIN